MTYYNYYDELYHYGVLGMKWGVRKDPVTRSDGLTGRKARKANRIEGRAERSIAKMTKKRDALHAIREQSRRRSAERFDKKIARAKEKGDTYKARRLEDKKITSQRTWKDTTKAYDKGYNFYNKVTKQYANTRVKALSDPSFKQNKEYKKAGRRKANQIISNVYFGSRDITVMNYASDIARGRNKKFYK